jgi:hypothetical protein
MLRPAMSGGKVKMFVQYSQEMEIRCMNPITGKTIEDADAEADAGNSETSEGYACVKPDEGMLILDWLNDSANEAVGEQMVTRHLRLCLHCREAVANWRFLHRSVEEAKPTKYASVTAEDEEPETASKAAKSTETGAVEETDLVELKAISHHGGN